MEIMLFVVILGLIPATIAKTKGRSFLVWWFYGTMILIIALPHSIIIPSAKKAEERDDSIGRRKCPYCAELIKLEAHVCRYCGKDVPENHVTDALSGEKAEGGMGEVGRAFLVAAKKTLVTVVVVVFLCVAIVYCNAQMVNVAHNNDIKQKALFSEKNRR